jgi:hypothetical protein
MDSRGTQVTSSATESRTEADPCFIPVGIPPSLSILWIVDLVLDFTLILCAITSHATRFTTHRGRLRTYRFLESEWLKRAWMRFPTILAQLGRSDPLLLANTPTSNMLAAKARRM